MIVTKMINPAHYDVGCPFLLHDRLPDHLCYMCAEYVLTNDSDEDDQPAHYSGDVGCPAGLQGVAAPCCVDYVLLL